MFTGNVAHVKSWEGLLVEDRWDWPSPLLSSVDPPLDRPGLVFSSEWGGDSEARWPRLGAL
eukprot:5240693-Alexandrium_andersonii.AAC.1